MTWTKLTPITVTYSGSITRDPRPVRMPPEGVIAVGFGYAALHIKPQTLRRALCLQGHYFGIRPRKLPSRFLAWPAEAIDRLTAGEEAAS